MVTNYVEYLHVYVGYLCDYLILGGEYQSKGLFWLFFSRVDLCNYYTVTTTLIPILHHFD